MIEIPNDLLRNKEVSAFNKLLLAVLLDNIKMLPVKRKKDVNSIEKLALQMNVSEDTIYYALQTLYNTGYIDLDPDKEVFYCEYDKIIVKKIREDIPDK